MSGRVLDSTTAAPIRGVRVSLRDGVTNVVALTNDSGRFDVRAPRAGTFALQLRQIGYTPRTIRVTLPAGSNQSADYLLTPLVATLDSMVTRASGGGLFTVTPGREFYRQHYARGIGQFISGLEIQRSRLSVIEYLGTIPGLKRVASVPVPSSLTYASSPPTIPGKAGFLLSSYGTQCLYGRVDRWSIAGLLDQASTLYLDDIMTADDIMGVEVYLPGEYPPEWKFEANQRIVRRASELRLLPGLSYLIGDTGSPHVHRLEIGDRSPPPKPPLFPIDSITQYNMVSISPPQCAFVQIWTRIAW